MTEGSPVDAHIRKFTGVQRETLQKLASILREVLPGAEECISYNMPCFKVHGKAVAGFDGFKKHNGYFPHSGNIVSAVGALPAGCAVTKGGLQFPLDKCLTKTLVRKLVRARLREIEERGR